MTSPETEFVSISDAAEKAVLPTYIESLSGLAKPKALLVVSAHWEAAAPTVMTVAISVVVS